MIPRLVIFDVDGTLVDSQRQIHASMTEAFLLQGHVAPELAAVLSIVGLSLPEAVARLAPDLPEGERGNIVAGYKATFNGLRAAGIAPLYPGIADALQALAARDDLLLGVATGKSRRGLVHLLQAYGIEDLFVTRQVADDHPSKPHPSMLLAALAETGIAPQDAVMIGDTTFDIEMAQAAGIAALGVAWGYHPAQALLAAGAGDVIASSADLVPALDALWDTVA